jgi:uncharacterized protein (UPF0548 family)
MQSVRKPTAELMRRYIAAQSQLDYTYTGIGTTAGTPPAGYVVDRARVKLGDGEEVYASARSALEQWKQFDLRWVEAWPADATLRAARQLPC